MQRTVQVLVDEPAIDREFTYLLPPELAAGRVPVTVGTVVRVPLHGRSMRGWVTEIDPAPPEGVDLLPVRRVASIGPPPHVVELARWAAWRWAGTGAHFLRIASSERNIAGLPMAKSTDWTSREAQADSDSSDGADRDLRVSEASSPAWVRRAMSEDTAAPAVMRLGPCTDEWPLLDAALRRGRLLVLVPTAAWAARLAGRLRHAGVATALAPRDWAGAATAHAVVGTRSAAWAPCSRLDVVMVLDEHDEAYQSEAAPTWNGRDVAVERAGRDGARCVLVGPMPSPDAARHGSAPTSGAGAGSVQGVITVSRSAEREAWPRVQIADRRRDDPATGEWCGEALTDLLRSGSTVVCVLNRTGRARLAYCGSCGELACSPETGRPLRLEATRFVDPDSGDVRPAVCESCGATRFRRARVGVKGVAEEMERLARRPVIQVAGDARADAAVAGGRRVGSADAGAGGLGDERARSGLASIRPARPPLYIGTEAVLHRVPSADAVAFLDFDQELTAPRYRAGEEAFALLVRAARLVGPRSRRGRILVQTRLPTHPVLRAAVEADPGEWIEAEAERREAMRQPPASAWALVSGAAAGIYAERVSEADRSGSLEITESVPGSAARSAAGSAPSTWRIRSHDRTALLDALAQAERPPGRLRVAVDPMRA